MKGLALFWFPFLLLLLPACRPGSPIPSLDPLPASGTDVITAENGATLVKLAELSQGDIGPVTALAFTPDKTQLRVVHAKTPALRHWSMPERLLSAEYELESVGLGAVAFDGTAALIVLSGIASNLALGDAFLTGATPDQVAGPADGIYLVDAETGQPLNRLSRSNSRQYHGATVSWDGRVIAVRQTANLSQASIVLDRNAELLVFQMTANFSMPSELLFSAPLYQQTLFVTDFALDPEGRLLAVYAGDGLVQLWDLQSGQKWGTLNLAASQSGRRLSQMAVAPTRQWLAAFSENFSDSSRQVALWRLDNRRLQWQTQVEPAFGSVNAFAFNPAGDLLAAAAGDGVYIWSAATGEVAHVFPGDTIMAVTFSHDGSRLAWGDMAGAVHLAGLPGQQ